MDTIPQDGPLKQCSNPDCKQWHPATTEFFYARKDGLNHQCKECIKRRVNSRYQKPEVRERKKVYDRLPESRVRQQRDRQKPENKAYHREYEYNRYHRPDVRESVLEYSRQPEVQAKHRENERRRTSKPDAKVKKYNQQREYRRTPRGKENRRISFERHRARKKSIPGTYTTTQILDLLKRQKYKCYYCSVKFEKKGGKYVYHIDHTFPLSRVVGTNIPANDIGYLVLACPHCNTSKGNRLPHEWPEGGRLL